MGADRGVPPPAVAALLGGVIVGTDETLGIVLIATGLLLVILHRYGRHHRPTPHG